MRADVRFEGAPQTDGGEIWFDSTALKRGPLLGRPRPRRQSTEKHGLKRSEKMELRISKLCERKFRKLVQRWLGLIRVQGMA